MNTDLESPPRRGSLFAIFLTVFIDLLGFGIVLPLLPIYGKQYALHYGWTEAQMGWLVGLLMASFSAMQFLFLPFWGRLSDRFGRRPILLIGLAGSTCFYALFGVAAARGSLVWLFVARIGAGIAGATISTAQAYIADTTASKDRTKGMALIGAAFALGFTIGPLIGAVSLLFGGQAELSPAPGYAAAGLSAAAWLWAFWRLPESLSVSRHPARWSLWDRSGWLAVWASPSIGLLLATSFIAVSSFASYESILSLAVEHLEKTVSAAAGEGGMLRAVVGWVRSAGFTDPSDVRLAVVFATFTYLGLVLTLSQGVLVRRIAGRVSDGPLAVFGLLVAAAGFVASSLAVQLASYGVLCLAMAVAVVGFSFVTPAVQSLISRRTSPRRQGHVLGVAQSVSSLARIVGPVAGIRLFAQGPTWPLWGGAAVMGAALVLVAIAVRVGADYPSETESA